MFKLGIILLLVLLWIVGAKKQTFQAGNKDY